MEGDTMGRLRHLFIGIIMTGVVLEATSQRISFEYVENYFNKQEETMQEKLKDLKDSMGEDFDKLSTNVKDYFNNLNFTNAKASELLTALEMKDWEKMEPTMLRRMSKEEIAKLASAGGVKIPKRFMDELRRVVILEMTDKEVVTTVRTGLQGMDSAEMSAFLRRLGPVASWTSDNITSFGVAALQLPVCLDETNNEKVLQELLNFLNTCEASAPPSGCPGGPFLQATRRSVTMKALGAPRNWKPSELENFEISEIPYYMIHQVNDDLVKDIKSRLIQEEIISNNKNYQMEGEAWLSALCEVERCDRMSADDTRKWLRNLSKMRSIVTPSDLSSEARKNQTLVAQLEGNAIRKGTMRAMDAAILLQMKLDKETPDTIRNIGGKLAAWAPACYLSEVVKENDLMTVRGDLSSALELVQGAEYKAKLNTAMKADMKAAFSNNIFSISRVSDYMKAFLTPKLLMDQNSATLLDMAKKADKRFINLDPYQMEVIVSKLSAADSQTCPYSLCQRLSVSFLDSLRPGVLADIENGLFGVTLPCLLGAKKMFSDKTTLTPKDIEDGKAFLKCMSYEDANKVEAKEIFNIFEKIKDGDLSWQACRAFKMKLMNWTDDKFNDTDKEDLLMRMYVKEMYTIPPCVAIMFEPSIYSLEMDKKKAFLSSLCNARNYFTIPKDARSRVVNKLLEDTMAGQITLCSMMRRNVCIFDLSPSMLRKMDDTATMGYVTMLENSIKEGLPDCLDSARMDEVAEMLTRIKGPARTWKTAANVSCILETYPSAGIDRLVGDLPAEVLITTGCSRRQDPFTAMPKKCKEMSDRAMMNMKRKKVEKCIKLREQFGTNDTTCDVMKCGNALRMTQSQLERMNETEVMKYLDDLVTEDLDTGKAKVILAKVKKMKPLKDMSAEELERLKNAWRGLTETDVANLPTLNPSEHDAVVYQLARTEMLSDDVMMALKDKILKDFKAPSSMRAMDVFLLGNLLCYLTENQVNAIPNDSIRKSMRNLGMVDCKNTNGTFYLAEAVKEASGKDAKDWDAPMVSEMNFLVGGLQPEDITALPDDAFTGLTPEGVQRIDPDTLKVMTVSQANNLDGSTAAAVTPAQARLLTADVRSALNNAKSENLRSSASAVSAAWVVVVAAVLFILH